MKKYIRIVAGEYRRTPIDVPQQTGLRPTPDRVRETLFNWLTHLWDGEFNDKHVLDLFAGSGALGFEAASRGVARVQMVESSPIACTALNRLRDKLGAHHVRIQGGLAQTALAQTPPEQFDLIMLDPPFGEEWFPDLLSKVWRLLKDDGLVYVEAANQVPTPDNYVALRQGRAGAVHYQLLQRIALQI